MATLNLPEAMTLPEDRFAGALAGRAWRPDVNGPSVVAVREDGVFDISAAFPTMRDLCEAPSPAEALRAAEGPRIGALGDILAHTPRDSRASVSPRLLAPIDLQAIKAAGVTFAQSLLERVIEERARAKSESRNRTFRLQARPLCIICGKPAEAKYICSQDWMQMRGLEGSNISGVNSRHTFSGDLYRRWKEAGILHHEQPPPKEWPLLYTCQHTIPIASSWISQSFRCLCRIWCCRRPVRYYHFLEMHLLTT